MSRGRYVRGPELQRMAAAEEVCWTLVLMMAIDALQVEDQGARDMLGKPLERWCDHAVATGQMEPGEEVAHGDDA